MWTMPHHVVYTVVILIFIDFVPRVFGARDPVQIQTRDTDVRDAKDEIPAEGLTAHASATSVATATPAPTAAVPTATPTNVHPFGDWNVPIPHPWGWTSPLLGSYILKPGYSCCCRVPARSPPLCNRNAVLRENSPSSAVPRECCEIKKSASGLGSWFMGTCGRGFHESPTQPCLELCEGPLEEEHGKCDHAASQDLPSSQDEGESETETGDASKQKYISAQCSLWSSKSETSGTQHAGVVFKSSLDADLEMSMNVAIAAGGIASRQETAESISSMEILDRSPLTIAASREEEKAEVRNLRGFIQELPADEGTTFLPQCVGGASRCPHVNPFFCQQFLMSREEVGIELSGTWDLWGASAGVLGAIMGGLEWKGDRTAASAKMMDLTIGLAFKVTLLKSLKFILHASGSLQLESSDAKSFSELFRQWVQTFSGKIVRTDRGEADFREAIRRKAWIYNTLVAADLEKGGAGQDERLQAWRWMIGKQMMLRVGSLSVHLSSVWSTHNKRFTPSRAINRAIHYLRSGSIQTLASTATEVERERGTALMTDTEIVALRERLQRRYHIDNATLRREGAQYLGRVPGWTGGNLGAGLIWMLRHLTLFELSLTVETIAAVFAEHFFAEAPPKKCKSNCAVHKWRWAKEVNKRNRPSDSSRIRYCDDVKPKETYDAGVCAGGGYACYPEGIQPSSSRESFASGLVCTMLEEALTAYQYNSRGEYLFELGGGSFDVAPPIYAIMYDILGEIGVTSSSDSSNDVLLARRRAEDTYCDQPLTKIQAVKSTVGMSRAADEARFSTFQVCEADKLERELEAFENLRTRLDYIYFRTDDVQKIVLKALAGAGNTSHDPVFFYRREEYSTDGNDFEFGGSLLDVPSYFNIQAREDELVRELMQVSRASMESSTFTWAFVGTVGVSATAGFTYDSSWGWLTPDTSQLQIRFPFPYISKTYTYDDSKGEYVSSGIQTGMTMGFSSCVFNSEVLCFHLDKTTGSSKAPRKKRRPGRKRLRSNEVSFDVEVMIPLDHVPENYATEGATMPEDETYKTTLVILIAQVVPALMNKVAQFVNHDHLADIGDDLAHSEDSSMSETQRETFNRKRQSLIDRLYQTGKDMIQVLTRRGFRMFAAKTIADVIFKTLSPVDATTVAKLVLTFSWPNARGVHLRSKCVEASAFLTIQSRISVSVGASASLLSTFGFLPGGSVSGMWSNGLMLDLSGMLTHLMREGACRDSQKLFAVVPHDSMVSLY